MKTWLKSLSLVFGISSCLLTGAWAQPNHSPGDEAAIQAIQQASDPSAVVSAYASGMAIDRNNPRLHAAYVTRMVDLGLPELAYHQAESLTTLDSNNGLAYGVIAYVNARRGQMVDAVSAINIAAPLAPDNQFVQRTAGEILAWYDLKADKTTIPNMAKDGLARVRDTVGKSTVFTQAYDTATKAYQAQASSVTEPQPSGTAPAQTQVQPQSSTVTTGAYAGSAAEAPLAPPAYYPDYASGYYPNYYYPDYAYNWGPGWINPSPAWWWYPSGYFAGFSFIPFSTTFVFGNDFHHHGFHNHGFHDGNFHHGNFNNFNHGNNFAFHNGNNMFWHQNGRNAFFGTPARANPALVQNIHQNNINNFSVNRNTWQTGHNQRGATAMATHQNTFSTRPNTSANHWNNGSGITTWTHPNTTMGGTALGNRTWSQQMNNRQAMRNFMGTPNQPNSASMWRGNGMGVRPMNVHPSPRTFSNVPGQRTSAFAPAHSAPSFAGRPFGSSGFHGSMGSPGFRGGMAMGGFHGNMGGFHGNMGGMHGGMGGGGFHGGMGGMGGMHGGMGGGHGGGGGGGHGGGGGGHR